MAMTGRGAERHAGTVAPAGAETLPRRVGRYEVRSPLAAAGLATVYEARDPSLHRRVALKVVRARERGDGEALEREAQAMARLAHPNVVAVFEIDRAGDEVWVAM